MAEAGVLREDDRLELVDGEIVEMAPIGHRHATCVRKMTEVFTRERERWLVDVQNPLSVSSRDELYPDLVLLHSRDDRYAGGIPSVADALLVIEVADTTLRYDRTVKLARYGASGVREVWIVDVEGARIWVHRKPLEGDYGEVFEARAGDVLTISAVPGFELAVNDILA